MHIFLLVFMLALALTMWARRRFRTIYEEERANVLSNQRTGAELARKILAVRGIENVEVVKGRGLLTDFYDPDRKRLSLSPKHYGGNTFCAHGIAANLAGQAIQDLEKHRPLQWRVSAVRTTVYLSVPLLFLALAALLAGLGKTIFPVLLMIWSMVVIANLATVPTELDAGERAKRVMEKFKPFRDLDERLGVERVMGAASTMHVDGIFAAISWAANLFLPKLKKEMEPEGEG